MFITTVFGGFLIRVFFFYRVKYFRSSLCKKTKEYDCIQPKVIILMG